MKNLKLLRTETKISQKKLAAALSITQQAVHQYESGLYEPDIDMMIRIASFFNTSVDYLIGNTDIRNKIEKVESFDLNEVEADMLGKYRKLCNSQQKNISLMIDVLINCGLVNLPGGYRIEQID
jgi:transcriptional regulator with XRE-family HTH domain